VAGPTARGAGDGVVVEAGGAAGGAAEDVAGCRRAAGLDEGRDAVRPAGATGWVNLSGAERTGIAAGVAPVKAVGSVADGAAVAGAEPDSEVCAVLLAAVPAVAGAGAGGGIAVELSAAGRAENLDGRVGATDAVETGRAGGIGAGSDGRVGDDGTMSGVVSGKGSGFGFRLKKLNMEIQINSAGAGEWQHADWLRG
jgi:hypothetical protein